MVKLRIEPGIHGVAGLARGRETCGNVVQNLRLEVLLVAGVAGCRESSELADRRVLVAVVALQQCMGADKWEAILVIADLGERGLPSLYGVTAFAVGSELAPMDVCVAVGAVRAYVLEYEADVAFGARNPGVHAAQRIACLIVIELRVGADWFPACVGVTLLAGNGNGTVRVCDFGLRAADTWPRAIRRLLQRRARKKREEASGDCYEPACSHHLFLRLVPRPGKVVGRSNVSWVKLRLTGILLVVRWKSGPEFQQHM